MIKACKSSVFLSESSQASGLVICKRVAGDLTVLDGDRPLRVFGVRLRGVWRGFGVALRRWDARALVGVRPLAREGLRQSVGDLWSLMFDN